MSGTRLVREPAAAPMRPAVEPAATLQGSAVTSPATAFPRRWRSAELFGPEQEIEIEHGQAVYRLRLTSLGKLILTK